MLMPSILLLEKGSTHMVPTFDLPASDTAPVKNLVSVDKDGRIEVLDAAVLDLIAGGAAPPPPLLVTPQLCNGQC
jgi:hypothetical protein